MKYKVDIAETYKRTMEVEAESSEEAYDKVDEMVNNGEVDLPCDGGSYNYERFLTVKED